MIYGSMVCGYQQCSKTPRTLPVDAKREREQIRKIQGCCCLDELEFWIPSKFQVGAVIVETWGEILGQLACETWAPGKDTVCMDRTWRARMITKTEVFWKRMNSPFKREETPCTAVEHPS
jgi:hypothetical protein